ncbi:hypothetical protein [Paenibacillus sp. LHD-38]|uniref:hypothetical protein n=1 Tax=Paenibacillus sp. LHD-38 TaxID=3072143 RepID=UPI00280DE9AB|nr:hypothetical protein [Paenibacillus sp. LHD-38]MDQ8735030.1 hypothetical protein [Paenibacillus sp. LHD-38]
MESKKHEKTAHTYNKKIPRPDSLSNQQSLSPVLGLGITFTLPLSLGRKASNPATAQLRITEPHCQRTFGIAWNKNHFLSQAAIQFRLFAINFFSKL